MQKASCVLASMNSSGGGASVLPEDVVCTAASSGPGLLDAMVPQKPNEEPGFSTGCSRPVSPADSIAECDAGRLGYAAASVQGSFTSGDDGYVSGPGSYAASEAGRPRLAALTTDLSPQTNISARQLISHARMISFAQRAHGRATPHLQIAVQPHGGSLGRWVACSRTRCLTPSRPIC